MLTDADSPIVKNRTRVRLGLGPDFCRWPGAALFLYYWKIIWFMWHLSWVEGVCGTPYSIVHCCTKYGEGSTPYSGGAWRGYCYVKLYELGPGWVRHHMTICIGYVLIHTGGLDRTVLLDMVYVLLWHDICVRNFMYRGCKDHPNVLHSDYHGSELPQATMLLPQYHLFG